MECWDIWAISVWQPFPLHSSAGFLVLTSGSVLRMLSRNVRTASKDVCRLQHVFSTTVKPQHVVNSHNEFDPLVRST